jgi:serine/threonine protein kinase
MRDRARELERLCQAALERPVAARAGFLAEACGGDESLRREAESLLARESAAASFLEAPALAVAARTMSTDTPALTVGQQIGPYTIVARLGSGGMGEVYRARDPTLRREVAIKVLPTLFTSDPDRLGRFEREARVLASLNHPNIATIHGVEHVDGIHALILEVVEGQTLAERLQAVASSRHATNAGLPLSDALAIARQIAEALEAAHEKGIVHRDLKPANIKIRPDGVVKVLDFGLAKAIATDGSAAEGSQVPTRTMDGTRAGTLLGTAAYMSPEQARGEAVDKRTDVWAFGCVLYEMLAGRPAFAAASVTETLSEVLKGEPDWQRLHAETPDGVRRLLRRCLAKDPKRRLRDIHDAHLDLDEVASPASDHARAASARPGRRERFAWASAVGLVAVIAGVLGLRAFRTSPIAPETRTEITTPPTRNASVAISPDGLTIVFAARSEGQSQLWLRRLDSPPARPLAGTEGASAPFWSPDSQSIGFFAEGKLKRIDVADGSTRTLISAPTGDGGAWNEDGSIIFSPSPGRPLLRLSAEGGEPTAVTRFESPQQRSHSFPQLLPDRRHFLFFVIGSPEARGVYVGEIDGVDTKRLFDADAPAAYTSSGHLLFVRGGRLLAQRFDPDQLNVMGDAVPIADQVIGRAVLSVSAAGPIVYRTLSADAGQRQLVWLDRSGRETDKVVYSDVTSPGPSLSHDGRRIAVFRFANGNTDVWWYDAVRRVWDRVTSHSGDDIFPLWSPDARSIVFGSRRGDMNLYRKVLNEPGNEELLLSSSEAKFPMDWSLDGRFLLYDSSNPQGGVDIWALPLDGERKPFEVIQTESDERLGQFSPNGKWIAYQSNKTGRFEIYLRPFPGPGGDVPVSIDGGQEVRWNPTGKELFYMAPDDALMTVPIRFSSDGTTVDVGRPLALLSGTAVGGTIPNTNRQRYVVGPDGQSFVMNSAPEQASASPITVILNWKPPAGR